MLLNYLKNYLILLSQIVLLFSQEIPIEFFEYKKQKLHSELGQNWTSNTIFGPFRYKKNSTINDSLFARSRFGAFFAKGQKMIYAYGHFTYKSNFHGYLHPRIVNSPDKFTGYSGIPRDISRGGFSSGETDLSGISFENSWMIIQFGRGKQSWGAGNDLQLALSEKSNVYDYGMLDLDFEKLRVRYFHGYLETNNQQVNRYITGRGIEWNNNTNFLLGLSEIIIYSGVNRPIDFTYLNPIATHLEIELNDRQNTLGTGYGNGIWQFSIDYLLARKIRISGNFLFDEFILDNSQKEEGKDFGSAYSLKAVISLVKNEKSYLFFNLSTISVGTNTFRHDRGSNNFIQRGDPLGWEFGSDTEEYKLGIDYLSDNKFIIDLDFGFRNKGEKNIINNPYEPYLQYFDESFPSGEVENIIFSFFELQWWWKSNLSTFIEFEYNKSNKLGKNFEWNIGFDVYYGANGYL